MEDGVEVPNVKVTLASKIPQKECERLNLVYRDPNTIQVEDWAGQEADGLLYVPKAGEVLYRVKREVG